MKKIVFTLCSNNYLAQAKTLGDSVKKFNPDIHFVVGLVDKLHPAVDYSFFTGMEILPFYELGFEVFDSMLDKYKIIEFNTAVKPFYYEYLFHRSGENTIVYYIDPDIEVFNTLEEANALLNINEFLVTPHITEPQIRINRFETVFLNVGIFNLGFLGLRKSERTLFFLRWWQERLKNLCFNNTSKGLFVDQIWLNFLLPLFERVYILKSPAYNIACWNLHERRVLQDGGKFYVNDLDTELVFFHFSGFKPEEMNFICKLRDDAYSLKERSDLVPLFEGYRRKLLSNKYEQFSQIGCLLPLGKKKHTLKQRIGLSLKRRVNWYINYYFQVE
jgi:hypothetical protein